MNKEEEFLFNLRKTFKNKSIVLVLGSFDLFHWEHLRFLNDAKKLGDVLVVAVKNDEYVSKKGNNRPIISQTQRLEIVKNIKSVDVAFLANCKTKIEVIKQETGLEESVNYNEFWLENFYYVFKFLQPNVLYYEENEELQSGRKLMKKAFNVKLISRKRTEIVSTTKIINKILNDKKTIES